MDRGPFYYDQYEKEGSAEERSVRTRLEAIDQAINTLKSKGDNVVGANSWSMREEKYDPIDTTSRQMGCCPNCFLEIPLSALRSHMSRDCSASETACPEVGCTARFSLSELRRHLTHECPVVRHRQRLIRQFQLRKEESYATALETASMLSNAPNLMYNKQEDLSVAWAQLESGPEIEMEAAPQYRCPLCEDCMPFIKSHAHGSICKARIIYCPNRMHGCNAEMIFTSLTSHLRNDCGVERYKEELIAGCERRKELVRCVGCGDLFPLKDLHKHEDLECPNRKVPCRNAHLGCPVVLRASMRKAHEEVDNARARIRFCLYLSGGGAHIALHEDDIVPPWTAEYWLYRPSAKEGAKQHIRAALQLVPAFVDAFSIEHDAKDLVDDITRKLEDKSFYRSPADMETALEKLAEAVEILEDAAVAAVAASKALGCAIGAAQSCLSEFLPASQRPMPYVYPTDDLPYTKTPPTSSSATIEMASLRLQPPGQASIDKRREQKVAKSKDIESKSHISAPPHREVTPTTGDSILNSPSIESNSSSNLFVDGIATSLLELETPEDPELEEVNEVKGEEFVTTAELCGEVQTEGPLLKLASTNPLVFAAVSETRNESLSNAENYIEWPSWRRPTSAPRHSAVATLLSLPSTFQQINTYGVPSVGTPYTPYAPTAKGSVNNEHITFFAQNSIPISALFLMQALRRDRRAGAGHGVISSLGYHTLLSWSDWWNVTLLLADALWDDKMTLVRLEQASGLMGKQRNDKSTQPANIQPAVSATSDGNAFPVSVDTEKKTLRKEKAKLRREAKMKKGQQAAAAEGLTESGKDASDYEEVTNTIVDAENSSSALRQATRLPRRHLRDRLLEAERVNCGAELLCASSMKPKPPGGIWAVNRICLDMAPSPLSWSLKNDTVSGEGGFVGTGIADARDGAIPGRVGVVLVECATGGPGCFSFPCGVPREQWCHLALVACSEPNRLVLYLDGRLRGSLRDCAMPLPMHAVGAPSPLSLSAALLDVRLWAKLRSQQEVQVSMSRLIPLETASSKSRSSRDNTLKSSHISSLQETSSVKMDLSGIGLVAWFPFEDGTGATRVLDVSEQRFPAALSRNVTPPLLSPPELPVRNKANRFEPTELGPSELDGISQVKFPGASPPTSRLNITASSTAFTRQPIYRPNPWLWLDADGLPLPHALPLPLGETDRPLPVPAFSSKGVCPYELRRLRLAQRGRQLYKEVNCPLGCDQILMKKDIKFHTDYNCQHRYVVCRFAPLCTVSFPLSQQGEHERADKCFYVRARLDRWRRSEYQLESVACEACGDEMRRRDLVRHLRRSCPHREVECSLGCGLRVQAHRARHHERHDCPRTHAATFLVLRARQRVGYARPWALEIPFSMPDRAIGNQDVIAALIPYGQESMSDPGTQKTRQESNRNRLPPNSSV